MMPRRILPAVTTVTAAAVLLTGCTPTSVDPVRVTGSSTVAPITAHMARAQQVAIEQTTDGTLDGFEEFCRGESHINNASVPITDDLAALCAENDIEFIELPIALDALSVVLNSANGAVRDLTMEELGAIWAPDSAVTTWADVRDGWPDEEIVLVGRPEGSGTFDYFTTAVNGEAGQIREDYRATDDIDELTGWIAGDADALGFMGIGNYLAADEEDRNVMATVAVDGVEPSLAGVQDGSYQALTRLLFLYVSVAALEEREDLEDFVSGYLDEVHDHLPLVYYYRFQEETYDKVRARFDERVTGSLLDGVPQDDVDIEALL
ncbi:phosphate ABC transporter substrate-binding protein, PhoT family [Corynebacterium pollutisoli]|uniref:Phosphate ABC transporter substrate-binding protein, PhoT family n=1 Tax=Corynebacterium pollutisoli TaxID=1610489 RepID=A0A1X7JH94_9CORY|nr:phosphate ABC transporter substrate-binding protein, PhoT family [Corynebacterium pollutisoli]